MRIDDHSAPRLRGDKSPRFSLISILHLLQLGHWWLGNDYTRHVIRTSSDFRRVFVRHISPIDLIYEELGNQYGRKEAHLLYKLLLYSYTRYFSNDGPQQTNVII